MNSQGLVNLPLPEFHDGVFAKPDESSLIIEEQKFSSPEMTLTKALQYPLEENKDGELGATQFEVPMTLESIN